MDPSVELSLLQKRFPDVKISGCGRLLGDFFCARSVDLHTYEGRLFLTENALLFVSTYSDAHDYDVFISVSSVGHITAVYRSIIPSLEVSLPDKQECFTNFYSLSGAVSILLKQLPEKVTEIKQSASLKRFSRLTSVPASTVRHITPSPSPSPIPTPIASPPLASPTSTSPDYFAPESVALPKADPCPFFIKAGFCPRKPLCKLDHTMPSGHTHQQQSKAAMPAASLMKSPSRGDRRENLTHYLGSPKRFHPSDQDNDMLKGSLQVPGTPASNLGDRGGRGGGGVGQFKPGNSRVGYFRSMSSPADSLNFSHMVDVRSSRQSREQGQMSTMTGVASMQGGEVNQMTKAQLATSESAIKEEALDAGDKENSSSQISPTQVPVSQSNILAEKAAKHVKFEDEEQASVGSKTLNSVSGVSETERVNATTEGNKHAGDTLTAIDTYRTIPKPPELPKMFNFSEMIKKESAHDVPVREKEMQQEKGLPEGEKDNVFVFSASSPASPPHVSGKRKNAVVRFSSSGGSEGESREGEGEGAEGAEEMAMLAQQLELESDNAPLQLLSHSVQDVTRAGEERGNKATSGLDSLQGDLDVEYQRRLLATFGNGKGPGAEDPAGSPVEESTGSSGSGELGKAGSLKRQPCTYFLSGFCRNGLACHDYHGIVPEVEEAEYGITGPVSLPPKLKVFSASSVDRSDINSGDKVILSPQILVACEQQELSYPVAFKLEHPTSGRLVHAGVLDFTSPTSDACYLPQWMMDHLQASEGDEVLFAHVDLPKGTFVRLQPVSSAWLGIQYDKRMAMMEFQLRNFQTLTEGTKVTLTYELNRYTLKVLECKPAKGISILDADITTDIVEPADFSRFHSIEEGQAEHIGLDDPVKCSVEANAYRHFVLLSLPGQSLPSRLRVEVKQVKGDPDLFLSQTCTAPTQSRYTWCNQDVGDSAFRLSTDDKDYDVTKPLHVGVVSLCEETEFSVTLQREDTLIAAKARQLSPSLFHSGQTLRTTHKPPVHAAVGEETDSLLNPASSSSFSSSSSSSSSLPPGHERCSYCGSVMPSLRLIMHERHCAQSTFKCPICKACLPKAAEEKHHFIAHELLTCECGKELTQLALHHHQETDCVKRIVKCPFKWCNLFFPMDQLQDHENLCGRKKVPCPICKEDVSQLELEVHLEAFHAVDTSTLDWSKPLGNQVLAFKSNGPKFKCVCGGGFDFQDDMEVHQLTECPMRRIAEDLATGKLQGEIVG